MKHLSFLVAVVLVFSCSLDYEGTQLTEDLATDIPEITLIRVAHTVVRDGVRRFRVEAQQVEDYPGKNLQLLSGVVFTEYNATGAVATSGNADHAVFDTETENVELTGNLRFYSSKEQAWVSTNALYWDSDARLLTANPDELVRVWKADGTTIIGRGFTADAGQNVVTFDSGVEGTLVEK